MYVYTLQGRGRTSIGFSFREEQTKKHRSHENILPHKEDTKTQQEVEEYMFRNIYKKKHEWFQSAACHVLSEEKENKNSQNKRLKN